MAEVLRSNSLIGLKQNDENQETAFFQRTGCRLTIIDVVNYRLKLQNKQQMLP